MDVKCVEKSKVDAVVEALREVARTGRIGDGKILVREVWESRAFGEAAGSAAAGGA